VVRVGSLLGSLARKVDVILKPGNLVEVTLGILLNRSTGRRLAQTVGVMKRLERILLYLNSPLCSSWGFTACGAVDGRHVVLVVRQGCVFLFVWI